MATKEQVEANRRNAKKSTGPKSEAGKDRVSRNAVKHGLTTRRWVLEDEDKDRFMDFSLSVQDELGAVGRLEALLAHRVALHLWRLGRVPTIEGELLERLRRDALGKDHGLGAAWERDAGPYGGGLGRLTRYETAIGRAMSRDLGELRRVQAARRQRERVEAAQAARAAHERRGMPAGEAYRKHYPPGYGDLPGYGDALGGAAAKDARPWWEDPTYEFPGLPMEDPTGVGSGGAAGG